MALRHGATLSWRNRPHLRAPPPHPVGNGTDGDTFWIVAEHGRSAAYVRNIEADPRVRVKVGRQWRSGTAALLPGDDPGERQRVIGRRFNAAARAPDGNGSAHRADRSRRAHDRASGARHDNPSAGSTRTFP
ncbi:MAG: nitroreductase family deazaflavin-dependent oxidoreductase [Actinomycetota bacterium]|nr:nitroreductase family deazaflavin-dependent oxidoreductase [Actinomycetota bacterium]